MKHYIHGCCFVLCVGMLLMGVTVQGQLTWSNGPAMSTPRGHHTATLLKDGRILIVGGSTSYSTWTDSVEIYDPVSNTYQSTGSLHVPRNDHSATLLRDGRLLVIGGYANGQYLDSAEIYNTAHGTWSVTQPLFLHGVNHTATLLKNGRVLVVAGAGYSGPDDRVEIFDPVRNVWYAAAPHQGIHDSATATLLNDGRVLFTRAGSPETDIYDPCRNSWQSAGPISTRFHSYGTAAVLLQNGRVMVIGGKEDVTVLSLVQVDVYDPATRIWSQAAPLHQERALHTATVLPDGRVMVAGGVKRWDDWGNPDNYLNSVEIYNPTTGQWEEGPALYSSRAWHTATLLRDGRLFVAGGATSAYLDSTEVLINNLEPLITRIGFSDAPYGDQDVTEFFTNETLYVSVNDVNLDATHHPKQCKVQVLLQGQGLVGKRYCNVRIIKALTPQPDGSFTGAIPLNRFRPGKVAVTLTGYDRSNYLFRQSSICIKPAQ